MEEKKPISWTMEDVNVEVTDGKVTSVTCKHCGKSLKFDSPTIVEEHMVKNKEGVLESQTVETFNTNPEDVIVHPIHECPKYGIK